MWFLVSQMVHWPFQSWEPGHSGVLTGLPIPPRFPCLIAWGFLQHLAPSTHFGVWFFGRMGGHVAPYWTCLFLVLPSHEQVCTNQQWQTSTQGVGFFVCFPFSGIWLWWIRDSRRSEADRVCSVECQLIYVPWGALICHASLTTLPLNLSLPTSSHPLTPSSQQNLKIVKRPASTKWDKKEFFKT